MAKTIRQRLLARVHIAKAKLGLDDDTYRESLQNAFQTTSARELDGDDLLAWAKILEEQLPNPYYEAHQGRPRNMNDEDRGPLLHKIEAYIAHANRPWNYVHAMALHMFKVQQVEWCTPSQLHKIVAALAYDARRRRAKK